MHQIAEHQRPNIEVTITPELRALFAGRYDPPGEIAVPEHPLPESAAAPMDERTVSEPAWQPVRVRRDGARPVAFEGIEVFGLSGSGGAGPLAFEHDLTLFQERDGDLICALRAAPRDALQRRPTYWCQKIASADDFVTFTQNWLRAGLAGFADPGGDKPKDPPDPETLLTQFDALTAQSLRMAQSH